MTLSWKNKMQRQVATELLLQLKISISQKTITKKRPHVKGSSLFLAKILPILRGRGKVVVAFDNIPDAGWGIFRPKIREDNKHLTPRIRELICLGWDTLAVFKSQGEGKIALRLVMLA